MREPEISSGRFLRPRVGGLKHANESISFVNRDGRVGERKTERQTAEGAVDRSVRVPKYCWVNYRCDPGTRVGPEKYEPLSIMELSTSTELFSIDIIVSILSIDN